MGARNIRAATLNYGPPLQRFGGHTAPGVDELGIEIRTAVPFKRVKGNPYLLELLIVSEQSKDTEAKMGFHVENAAFTVAETDGEREIFVWYDAIHRQVNNSLLTTEAVES